jgi:hypothetical protein
MAAAVAAFTCGKACSAFSRWRGRTRSLTLTSLRLLAEIREQGHTGSMNLLVYPGWEGALQDLTAVLKRSYLVGRLV